MRQENVLVPKEKVSECLQELLKTGKTIFLEKTVVEYLETIATDAKDRGYYKEYTCTEGKIAVLNGTGRWKYVMPKTCTIMDNIAVHVTLK